MKNLAYLALALLFNLVAEAQINLTFDPVTETVLENTNRIPLKAGNTYRIRVSPLNSAYIESKITTKSLTITSATPAVLQTFFPGITNNNISSLRGMLPVAINNKSEIFGEGQAKYLVLEQLKTRADNLYATTKFNCQPATATAALQAIVGDFNATNVPDNSDIKRHVKLYIQFVLAADAYFQNIVLKDPAATDADLAQTAELHYMAQNVAAIDYFSMLMSVINSLTCNNYVESKSFKAKKDVVEASVLLIDTYKKDTLYNSKLSFYTRSNFAFHFSSGFFYNDISEKTYYVSNRNAAINNIIEEDGNRSYDIAFGALGHVSYKLDTWLRAGVGVGAAVSMFDGKIRYLVGPSLMFGRQQQLGINAGWSFAKVKVLSTAVFNDQIGYHVPAAVTSVPTNDRLETGVFIGITYNLFSTKE
jgi:hypothetical protein